VSLINRNQAMPDLVDEFATWIVLNAIDDVGDYKWVRRHNSVSFEWLEAVKEWIKEQRLYGFQYLKPKQLLHRLYEKPYYLRRRSEGPTRVVMLAISVTTGDLDVPRFLGWKKLYHPRRDEWSAS
jgi:hypothetical protein